MKKIFITIFVLIILAIPPKTFAQSVDLGIYPPIFQVETTPPTDVKVPFFVQNFTDQNVDLSLVLKPFTASGAENGEITFIDNTVNPYPDPFILQRVKVLDNGYPINGITLSAKQKKNLTLEIQLPSNEIKGEYYFSLIFSANPGGFNNSNVSAASGGIASNVLLSVGPLGKTQGIIQDFSGPRFVLQGPVTFTVRLQNTSDHYITPKGDIEITNMFRQNVGKVNLLPINVLSNTIRRIPDSLQSSTASDKDYAKIQTVVEKNQYPVAVWPEKFLFGPYTATLTLALSDQGPLFKKQFTFFAFPAEYILGILAVIAIVVFVVLRVRGKMSLK